MSKYADQQVSFKQGGDTGQADSDSIQPHTTEPFIPTNANRPLGNLRTRSETLRRALEDLLYLSDADRSLILWATSAFTFAQPASGEYTLSLASGNLWIYPALTPGRQSGGRPEGGRVFCENSAASNAWTPYSGTSGVDDLILTAHRQYTGQRGYYDADSLVTTPSGRSLGAQRILVDLVADAGVVGGLGTITATITQAPRTKIRIVYGTATTPTTLANLIAFINGDRTSQGAYGVADFLRASTTGTSSNAPTPFTNGEVQGGYDAEAHQITKAQIDAFFAVQDGGGAYINRLREGEGLAIAYPLGLVDRTSVSLNGGRRQSLWDLPTDRIGTRSQNTTPASGYLLFTTGREPEKIPGSLPIGKVIEGEFVFTDGTRLAPGDTVSLGESRVTLAALAATTAAADGSRRVGYEGSGNWHSDAAASANPNLAAGTVNAALSAIVSQLATATANQSGARRIGMEPIAGAVTSGNEDHALSILTGSLRAVLAALLNGTDGINSRVSELGHRMSGGDPLRKEYGAGGMPVSGAIMTLAELQEPDNTAAATPIGVREVAHMVVQPLVFDDGADGVLAVDEVVEDGTGAELLFPTGSMSSIRFAAVTDYFPVVSDGLSGTVPLIYAKLSGVANAADAEDGWYTVYSYNTGTNKITFRRLDGSTPDFTGMDPATITFYTSIVSGNDRRYTRWHGFHHSTLNASPIAVLGVGSSAQRILDIYVPNANVGTIGLRVKPSSIEFEGVAMNATKAGVIQSFLMDEVDLAPLASDFTSPEVITLTASAGRTLVGVYIRVTATILSNAAGLVRYQLVVTRTGSSVYAGVISVEWEALASDESRTVAQSIFVPLTGGTTYNIARLANTNVKVAGSSVAVSTIGRLQGF